MKLLLTALLAMQSGESFCPAYLKFSGVGATAVRQVQPYADCLNSTLGTPEQLQAACSTARAKALEYRGSKAGEMNVAHAVRWLDGMVRERSFCEAHLEVAR